MNSCKPRIMNEISKIIPIPQNSTTNKKEGISYNEYS